MTDANLEHLHPTLRTLAIAALMDWTVKYPKRRPVAITVTWRSAADQQKAYDEGKSNAKPGQGLHEYMINGKPAAKAFDYAVYDEDGVYIEDGTDDWYADFAGICKALGLKWGGDWHKPDYDHIELLT